MDSEESSKVPFLRDFRGFLGLAAPRADRGRAFQARPSWNSLRVPDSGFPRIPGADGLMERPRQGIPSQARLEFRKNGQAKPRDAPIRKINVNPKDSCGFRGIPQGPHNLLGIPEDSSGWRLCEPTEARHSERGQAGIPSGLLNLRAHFIGSTP